MKSGKVAPDGGVSQVPSSEPAQDVAGAVQALLPAPPAELPSQAALHAVEGPESREPPAPVVGRGGGTKKKGRTPGPNAKRVGMMTAIVAQHVKSRLEKPGLYPPRNGGTPVPATLAPWSTPYPDYAPGEPFTAQVVLDNAKPGGWADPADPKDITREIKSYTGPLQQDAAGRPLNPMGRTGIAGRGLLGRWGPNFAADPIVVRQNPETGQLEMLAIRRKDTGQWAIPGGMVDEGEAITQTLAREFKEEAGVKLDMSDALELYRGYADDPRNTDHAWMETTVCLKVLSPEQAAKMKPKAGDDAVAVQWMALSKENIAQLYGNHAEFVRLALAELTKQA